MKASLEWLKELVDFDVDPYELASSLEMAGIGVESIEKIEGDFIFNLEITPNRPDCLGHIGIAREISAIYNRTLKLPEISYKEAEENIQNFIKVEIQDGELCPRYCGIVVRDFKIGPSPDKMKRRLESLGLRAINNAVDITNYVLLLTGHPVHAFDIRNLRGGKIIVRRARRGEWILTLDGDVKNLDEETLVIADGERPVAIAGIIGGEDSGVKDFTTDIFVESAYFDPITIRRTSKRLGKSTEASYRFERGVDRDIPPYSARLCATLFHQMGGKIARGIIDAFPKPINIEPIILRSKKLSELLGIDVPAERIEEILRKLEFKILSSKRENGIITWSILPPSFRGDIKEEADLIEEVARFYGYEKIPSTIPPIVLREVHIDPVKEKVKLVEDLLNFQGWNEIITFGFIDPEEDVSAGKDEPISIMNPISSRFSRMRRSLLPGILKTVSLNLSRDVEGGKIFEIGKVYWKEENFVERNNLALALFGEPVKKWSKGQGFSILSLKGTLSLILSLLGYKDVNLAEKDIPIFDKFASLSIFVNGKEIGGIGKVRQEILKKFNIETDVYYCEFCLDNLFAIEAVPEIIHSPPRFPSVRRDISFIISRNFKYSEIENEIKKIGIKELEEFFLWDIFKGGEIPAGKISMTIGFIFRSQEKTLTHSNVNEMIEEIERVLREKFKAQIRGKDV